MSHESSSTVLSFLLSLVTSLYFLTNCIHKKVSIFLNLTSERFMLNLIEEFIFLLSFKFSYESSKDYPPSKNYDSFYITPKCKAETDAMISSLNSNKSTGSISIPVKTLKLTQNEITQHLVDIFNLTFKTGIFRSSLKIAQMIPIRKKDAKLIVSNYEPTSILSNLDKILEKLIHIRLMKFLDQKILYSKQF